MNEYFTSIGPDLAAKVPVIDIGSESYVDSSESVFVFKSINIDGVYNALNSLKASKSTYLNDSCFSIAPFLTQTFNASLASCVFPQDWKIAHVWSIYKAGDKRDRGNYRQYRCYQLLLDYLKKLFIYN